MLFLSSPFCSALCLCVFFNLFIFLRRMHVFFCPCEKMKLTEYLARKALDHAEIIGKRLVADWGTACEATHKNVAHLRSS